MQSKKRLSIRAYLSDPQTRAVAYLFILNALLFSQWVVRIPTIKELLDLNDATLGLALLTAPLGVVLVTPLVGMSIRRFGAGRVSQFGAVLYIFAIILLGQVSTFIGLFMILFLIGIANGALDISMNAVVTALEKQKGAIFMSMSHGFWSLSAMLFSLIASLIVGSQLQMDTHLLLAAIVGVFFIWLASPSYTIKDEDEQRITIQIPNASAFLLVFIAFIIFMIEGGIIDWNAVYFKEVLDSPEYMIGFGFATFSFAMAIARFHGDKFIERYSTRFILLNGCFILAIGLGLFSLGASIFLSLIAMLIAGLGCSVLIPVVFHQAGKLKDVPPSLGIASVSTFGYTGFLVGPPLIGFLSESFSLQLSFLILALLAGLIGLLSMRLRLSD